MDFPTEPRWGTGWIGASATDRGAALADLLAPLLTQKVLAIDQALEGAEIPHAIGGAIALAYYGEPRVTIDIDVNVFVSTERLSEIERALRPLGVDPEHDERELVEDQQVRFRWDRNPVHLFFSHDELHEAMPTAVRRVPLAGSTIPIVSPEHLVIRKAMLDRPKDWPDIEAILAAETPLDLDEIRSWSVRLAEGDDSGLTKLDQMLRRFGR
jgi:Nucleotidyl transferase AbiEii toxin, Type IV TA system